MPIAAAAPDLPLLQRLISHPVRLDQDPVGLALPPGHEPGPDGSAVPVNLRLPLASQPEVSIVIPIHNQYAVTAVASPPWPVPPPGCLSR